MKSATSIFLALSLTASCAAAQSGVTELPTRPALSAPATDRSGVQVGGVPPFFVSGGGYTTLTDLGAGQLEGRVLVSALWAPTFITAFGAEADVLVSYPLSPYWRAYGGVAAGATSSSNNGGTNYLGLGGLVGVRSGPGFGFFVEAGAATFFGGVTGPFGRLGVKYSF